MKRDIRITTEQLHQAVHGYVEELLNEVTGVVNLAPKPPVTRRQRRSYCITAPPKIDFRLAYRLANNQGGVA